MVVLVLTTRRAAFMTFTTAISPSTIFSILSMAVSVPSATIPPVAIVFVIVVVIVVVSLET